MLLRAVSFPVLLNPGFALGLFHPHHAPDSHFWNKPVSLIEHTEVINDFLKTAKKMTTLICHTLHIQAYPTTQSAITSCLATQK